MKKSLVVLGGLIFSSVVAEKTPVLGFVIEADSMDHSSYMHGLQQKLGKKQAELQETAMKIQQKANEDQQKMLLQGKSFEAEEVKFQAQVEMSKVQMSYQKFERNFKEEFEKVRDAACKAYINSNPNTLAVQFVTTEQASKVVVADAAKITPAIGKLMDKEADKVDQKTMLASAIKPISPLDNDAAKGILLASNDATPSKDASLKA